MLLSNKNQTSAAIIKGAGDDLAAMKIAAALGLPESAPQPASQWPSPLNLPPGGAIVVGSVQSNALVKPLLEKMDLMAAYQRLSAEGFLLKTHDNVLGVFGGDRVGTLYGACELKNYYLRCKQGEIRVDNLQRIENPALKYRWLWNWDSRTHWFQQPNRKILRRHGNGFFPHPYECGWQETFLRDFKTMLDFCGENRINGVVIWGLLRDEHGGVPAAQEICRYARERGVRIIAGLGPNQYNGFYYSGNHRFNIVTWTARRPELQAVGPVDGYEVAGPIPSTVCLLKRENQAWLREGVNWMYDNLDIGGLDVETSEAWVCNCEEHKRLSGGVRLGTDGTTYMAYPADVELAARIVTEEAYQRDPKTWIVLNTYNDLGIYPEAMIQNLMAIAPEAVCLWLERERCFAKSRYPGNHKTLHFNWSPRGYEAGFLPLQWYQESIANAWRNGMEGVQIHGEGGNYLAGFELGYQVFSALAWNPELRLEQLVEERLARWWGGKQAALGLLEILPLMQTDAGAAHELAERHAVSSDVSVRERWEQLLRYLKHLREK